MPAIVLLDQVMLVLAVCATAGAALRMATRITGAPPRSMQPSLRSALPPPHSTQPNPSVAERVLVAACLAGAFLVCWTLALGVVGLSGSVAALAAGPLVAWVATRWLVRGPSWSVVGELTRRWHGATPAQRASALALVGVGAGCIAEIGRQPGLGIDALQYHLPDALGWLHSGHAGAVQTFSYDVPVGYFPITNEVLLSWVLGISRSFAPLAAWSTLAAGLALLALWRLLELLRVPRIVAGAALAALATLPLLVIGLNVDGPGTDLPAVTWLACTAALSAGAAARPALLGPALLAAGLGIGTKATVAPLAVVALLAGAWAARHDLRSAHRWLAAGAVGALLVGGTWYLRSTVDHGWPLWPFSAGPTGDPVPRVVTLFGASFLSRPGATLSGDPPSTLYIVAVGLALVVSALLLAILTRTRGALLWTALGVASVLAWTAAPLTGIPAPLGGAIRYLLAPLGACAVALAIGARDGTAVGRRLAVGVFAVASAGSLVADISLGYPTVPRVQYLLAGAVAGAAVGAISQRILPPLGGILRATSISRRALAPAGLRVAAVLLAVLLLSASAPGWLGREARDGQADSGVLAFMLSQPGFRSGSEPIAFAQDVLATLAGPRLRHSVSLIPPREPCGRVRARLLRGWVVLRPGAFVVGISTPFDTADCLRGDHPLYDDGMTLVYSRASLR